MLLEEGIRMPVHVGLAGPTKLQTLIKFAISCGVGPSLKILQKRALDLTKLLTPYEPTEMLQDLSCLLSEGRAKNIEGIHFFPLGGISSTAAWLRQPAT
jgi:methylenetetrahydrofolate reductase (NADPH)